MNYLFGDSTPSPFRVNHIELLRLALDFSVHVLEAEGRISQHRSQRAALEQSASSDDRQLQDLLTELSRALETVGANSETCTGRVALAIRDKARQVVDAESGALKLKLAGELAAINLDIANARKGSLEALERLLLKYDLPQTTSTLRLHLADGTRYVGELDGSTPYGLHTRLDLTIPAGTAFSHDARVDQFAEGLEIHAPETGGWIRKESRMTPHKVGRYFITELSFGEEESMIRLRASPETNVAGYDLMIQASGRVDMIKHTKDETPVAFEVEAADIPAVLAFHGRLVKATQPLTASRRALIQTRIDGQPIEEYEEMSKLIEQLIDLLAPSVREIAAHSLSPNELVLRRMIDDDRREEIFVSKGELREKLAGLDENRRQMFAPLNLFQQPRNSKPPRAAAADQVNAQGA
jgi:hypothetical protein